MGKRIFAEGLLKFSGVSLLALAAATPVLAQDAPPADGETIVVTGFRASIAASLDAKRDSVLVSEVVTAQDIGKFPDKNVADSLGRLTGVNVVTGSSASGGFGENQSVTIRGTDPSLNLTLLDGHSVATGDWFVLDQMSGGRSFNFSLLPSEIVGSLKVFKSQQADLQEGGVGGTINIVTRRPLDLESGTVNASAQLVHNTMTTDFSPNLSGVVSWKNADETFGVLVSGFWQERNFRRDGQEFLGYGVAQNFNGTGQTVAYPSLIGSAYFTQKRVRKGGSLTLQWQPSDRVELVANGIYTRMDADNVNVNSMLWTGRLIGNNSTPGTGGYALGSYSVKDGYLTSASWNATTADGSAVQGRVQDDIFRKAYSSTWVANLDGRFEASDRLTFTGQIGYTKGMGATTDTFAWETYWDTGAAYSFAGKHAEVSYPGLSTDLTSPAYLNNFYSWSWGGAIKSPDEEFYGKLDAEYELDGLLSSIKVGGRYARHERSVDYQAYSWGGNGLYSGTNLIGLGTVFNNGFTPRGYGSFFGATTYPLADVDKVQDFLDNNAGGRNFDFYAPESWSLTEKTAALYAMAGFGRDGDAVRGNFGLRAVHTDLKSTQYAQATAASHDLDTLFGYYDIVNDSNSYWDFLPSANISFNASDDVVLRGAVARVMSRPGYADLAGAFSLNDLALTGTAGGNVDLDPYRAWQFNVAAEYYYAPEALISVNLFYLKVQSYVTTATTSRWFVTEQNPNGAWFLVTSPVNGPGGRNQGVEVNWQQPLFSGFGLLANYTYSDAKNDDGDVMDGNSKHSFNLTGYYENELLSARLAYGYRSKFRSGIDRATPMWQDDFGQLDASLQLRMNKNVSLTLDAQNLTNSKLYYFVGDKSVPRAWYNNGRTFWLGARFSL